MTTKYDVKDEVLIKAKIRKVISSEPGKVEYMLGIMNVATYVPFGEGEIVGKFSEQEESDGQMV